MTQQNYPMKLAEMAYVYAKMKWMRTFKAFDLTEGCFVGNLIHASMLMDSEENRNELQQLANDNATAEWIFQLRKNGRVTFQTK